MPNNSIALNQNAGALSSGADFNRSPEIEFHQVFYDSVKMMMEEIRKADIERQVKKREAEAREREDQLKAVKKAYDWKLKKAENLKFAYAILLNKKHQIELIPNFDHQAFLEVVKENFSSVELRLLADIVHKAYEELKDRINKIKYSDDVDLYYEYHTYYHKAESAVVTSRYDGKPECHDGIDLPTIEMLEMEAENELLLNLYCELNDLAQVKPNQEELETLKQALAA